MNLLNLEGITAAFVILFVLSLGNVMLLGDIIARRVRRGPIPILMSFCIACALLIMLDSAMPDFVRNSFVYKLPSLVVMFMAPAVMPLVILDWYQSRPPVPFRHLTARKKRGLPLF